MSIALGLLSVSVVTRAGISFVVSGTRYCIGDVFACMWYYNVDRSAM